MQRQYDVETNAGISATHVMGTMLLIVIMMVATLLRPMVMCMLLTMIM
jgi:hypothetical protein